MTQRTSIFYDPVRQGIDLNELSVLDGTLSLNGSGKIVVNSASFAHLHDLRGGEVRFLLNIPAAPTAGDARRFGLYVPATGSGFYFDITDTAFKAIANDVVTGATVTDTITFETGWANSEVEYKIVREPELITFYVDKTRKSVLSLSSSSLDISSSPMSVYVKNSNADNMLLSFFEVIGADSYK